MPGDGQHTLDSWLSKRPAHSQESPSSRSPRSARSSSTADVTGDATSNIDRARIYSHQREKLAAVATETRTVLPDILQDIPNVAAAKSEAMYYDRLPPLKKADCPKLTPTGKTRIRIVNEDTFNVAIELAELKGPDSGRVAVLNMASDYHAGGGWLKGALAQEEALCYRSSLYLSLHKRYYPWRRSQALYTPDVVIIRSDMASGHQLLVPDIHPDDLPIVSVLSIAALRQPKTRKTRCVLPDGKVTEKDMYLEPEARDLMKGKMRMCLRMAAHKGHGLLVLGALGCGAFRNPKDDVAECWLEVLKEEEFEGGWWEEVVFAVFDRRGEGNFEVFEDVLGGVEV